MRDWPAGLQRGWYPVAYSNELGTRPLSARLMDRPLVLFRGTEGVAVLEDRCPHRNVPLSAGRIANGLIECPYHGWRFDAKGKCRLVPGSGDTASGSARSFAVREQAGMVWTTLAEQPDPFPHLPSEVTDIGYDSFWWALPPSRAAIGDAIENLVDPVHAYFLHPGLVRRSNRSARVDVDFAIDGGGAKARYIEARKDMTWLQRFTEGRRTSSWGHYRSPTQVQIGFEDDLGIHASIFVIFTPVASGETRPFACFSTRRGRVPAWIKRLFILTFHNRVLAQDLRMLALQKDNCDRFGGPDYRQGPLDLFGPAIWSGLNGLPLQPVNKTLRLEI